MQISGSIRCCLMTLMSTAMSIVNLLGVAAHPRASAKPASTEADVLEIDRLPVDAHHRRCDPAGELARIDHAAHQRCHESEVVGSRQPLVLLGGPFLLADHAAVG